MTQATIVVCLAEMPEVVWSLCHQLTEALREAAADEEPRVQQRMIEVAADFEAAVAGVQWPENES